MSAPIYTNVRCSQCGQDPGPGDAGVSSCKTRHHTRHAELRASRIRYGATAAARRLGLDDLGSAHAECGVLGVQISVLCAELEGYQPTRHPSIDYIDVSLPESDYTVTVGYAFEGGERESMDSPGYGPEVEVQEVWLNGADIAPLLLERISIDLTDLTLVAVLKQQAAQRDADLADLARDRAEVA